MNQIQDLFKIPLYKTDLSLNNKAMANYCLSLSKKDKGRILSNEGGWQSNDLQGFHPVLNELFVSIENHCSIFTKELDIKCSNKIDNIWININGYKDINKPHSHPHSLVSGVYYIQMPKDCGHIVFQHPTYDCFQYDWTAKKVNNFNVYNSAEWIMPGIIGKLYLFPGWLNHYVQPNLNKKEKRISISFNFR